MTRYHPDTYTEITRLHNLGMPPEYIATETGVPVTYVITHTIPQNVQNDIIAMWHNGTGKREISALLNTPLTTIQAVIRAKSPHQNRPPTQPTQPPRTGLTRIDLLLAAGRRSPRETTRKLAERTAANLAKLRKAIDEEKRQKRLAARVEQATRKLAEARAAKKGTR